ncbi:hypothetical protein ES288_D08G151200v1 [Gossypium darwinii]|uniref:Cation-transporting P-type ATPase N-terminal domain-containing protein n=1 Tax=Gossypium darwinii TaxID=34276 RepID=A0A5D2BPB1_GOSDA|nr:hypothetical protein ES288_D08G151200v1 [Gossypium darwinii]
MGDKNEVLEAIFKEIVDLENIPIEEVFENLRCSREGLTTEAAEERLTIFGHNRLEEKKDSKFLKFLGFMWNPLSWVVRAFEVQPKSDGYNFQSESEPGGSRLQLGAGSGVPRLRSSSLKKPPELLCRAVVDCLSSSSLAAVAGGVSSHHQGGPLVLTKASRTLRGAWQPSLNISTVLTSIRLLLSEPNPDNGLMCEESREYKYNRQAFDQKARSMTKKFAKVGAGESSCSYQCTETKVDSTMCAEESRQYGISGVLSYGLLNTICYIITFLLVCHYSEVGSCVTGRCTKPVTIAPNASNGGILLRRGSFGL